MGPGRGLKQRKSFARVLVTSEEMKIQEMVDN
jgi:hypothetical protein